MTAGTTIAGSVGTRPTDAAPGPWELAAMLRESLPAGSGVAVRWQCQRLGDGGDSTDGASRQLQGRVDVLLEGRDPTQAKDDATIGFVLDQDGCRVAVAAEPRGALPAGSAVAWQAMARRVVLATMEAAQARARIESLEKSERLQQSLYQIADLAGSGLEMSELLRRIHAVVGSLMYAENLYIVLYDDVRDSVRFLYFADNHDPYVADPAEEIPLDQMRSSLTAALLRHGKNQMGPSSEVRARLGVPRDPEHGPDSMAWLGVPMRRDGRVSGAIVVQSYDSPASYDDEDRALLEFVAQHILTTLDRRQARDQLERRVEERTRELQDANRDLQAQIAERQRAEKLQRAFFRIAELSITSESLEQFYAAVHGVVDGLLYARNFYIALLTPDGEQLEFPYSIDERDSHRPTRRLSSGLTEYVLTTGKALLAQRADIAELQASDLVHSFGPLANCWLGVPLYRGEAVVGVIAVQSYSREVVFTPRDQELLTFVAHHIGSGLIRKRAQDRLVAAHAELEQRVAERTRELAEANNALTAQIGERLRAEEKLIHQATHDTLTGLPNRMQLLERLGSAITRARSGGSRLFAVLFLDLDRFKLVNDSVGHAAGDEMLVEAGRRLVAALRPGDIVARLGGDEFAILVEDIEDQAAVEELARRILVALSHPIWVAGRELFPTASIGIAMWHPSYRGGEELLRDADAAMYRAKSSGRDRSAVFDEAMRDEAMRLLDLEADLRRAVLADAFEPYYQPIVRLSDNVVVGHEALLRWRHDHRGLLLPGDFIGIGEDSGLIEQVDWLMYARVIDELSHLDGGYVSINVSPRHLRNDDFAPRLLGLLDEAGVGPGRLRIEITEIALLDDATRALRTLRTLRDHGVLAQLDDFGTGFSALSYLHRFPIQSLKIDQSFIAELSGHARSESMALIRAINALADTLGIETIGEGIETEAQLAALRELGCGYGQGYLLGRPHPDKRTTPAWGYARSA